MAWGDSLFKGLSKSRLKLGGQLNQLFGRGMSLDDDFFEELEEALIMADMGVNAVIEIVAELKLQVAGKAIDSRDEVVQILINLIASEFSTKPDPLAQSPVTILMVGINGTGKTTSAGKLAKQFSEQGRSVVLGSADTFRAAASEQLEVWSQRAQVPLIRRDRGADAASVAFETVEMAEKSGADVALIDTAGRLHTSADLMRELEKVQRVVRERSAAPTVTVLVIDATTGQNGLVQAREFHKTLTLDALIVTKLDGTAKGGIAVAIGRELGIPIVRIGVGESIEDLRPFNPHEFTEALVGIDV